MGGQITAVGCLVERTVEGRDEEHKHLSAHTNEQHDIGKGKVRQLKKGSKDNDRGTPAIGIVEKGLTINGINPLLQTIHQIVFTMISHNDYLFFCFPVVELANERTQRKPM